MRTIVLGGLAVAALLAPLALSTGSANAAPAAPKLNHGQCVSGSVHAGVTGAAHEAIAQDNSLVGEYGTSTCPLVVPVAPPKADIEVKAPVFGYGASCSVTVPFTEGIETRLYGVNGHPETDPITGPVTVTAGLDGASDTAPQFWVGYKAKPGYVLSSDLGTTHIDFYNGDYSADCGPQLASSGPMTWTVDLANFGFGGIVNGTTQFHADATGGTLDYTNDYDGGKFLHATIDPNTFVKTGNTATFRGTITSASPMYNGGKGFIVVNVVDNGPAGDKIAVFVNEEPHDGILADVVTGNLTVNGA